MPHFRVILQGTGIRVPAGRDVAVGFYATRAVRAASAEEAVMKAKQRVMENWTTGEYAESNKGNTPTLETESVERIGFLAAWRIPNSGHAFYTE
jgi:hypothetical protein